MKIIKCYADTSYSSKDDKDPFYETLESTLKKCPGNYLTILVGNLCFKDLLDSKGHEDIMERLTDRKK